MPRQRAAIPAARRLRARAADRGWTAPRACDHAVRSRRGPRATAPSPRASNAASFDGTWRTATVLRPLLSGTIRMENRPACSHSRRVRGKRSPSTSATIESSVPAMVNRPAANSIGGISQDADPGCEKRRSPDEVDDREGRDDFRPAGGRRLRPERAGIRWHRARPRAHQRSRGRAIRRTAGSMAARARRRAPSSRSESR